MPAAAPYTITRMATFLNATLNSAMIASQGTQTMGVFMTVGFMILSAYIEYQLAIHSMEMITKVPSMVAEMLGVRDIGGEEHQKGSNVVGGIISTSSNHMTQSMQAGMQGAMPKGKQEVSNNEIAGLIKGIGNGKTDSAPPTGGGGGNEHSG